MTTPQLKPHPQTVATVATATATAVTWEPFPPQPPKRLDMEQALSARALIETLRHILTTGFRDAYHPTILVDDQIPIFYDPGTPPGRQRPVAIPDCTIALDVDTRAAHARWGYDPTQLGKPPDLVIEFASRSAYRNDLTTKRDIYRDLRIMEYWRFDATGGLRYGRPITGERLEGGEYRQLPTLRYGYGIVGSTSIVLDLNFRWNGRRFTIHNPYTGVEYLHSRDEIVQLSAESLRLQAEKKTLAEATRVGGAGQEKGNSALPDKSVPPPSLPVAGWRRAPVAAGTAVTGAGGRAGL